MVFNFGDRDFVTRRMAIPTDLQNPLTLRDCDVDVQKVNHDLAVGKFN